MLIAENLKQRGFFLRCVQYIVSQKCWKINRHNAIILLKEFFKERKQGSIISTISFSEKEEVEFSNKAKDMIDVVRSIFVENSKSLKENLKILSLSSMVDTSQDQIYKENKSRMNDMKQHLHAVMTNDVMVRTIQEMIRKKIDFDFQSCRNVVTKNFEKCKIVYFDKQTKDRNQEQPFAISDKLEVFKQKLSYVKEYKRLTFEYMKDIFHGIVYFDVKAAKTSLEKHIENTMQNIKEVLKEKFVKMLEDTKEQYEEIHLKLTSKVETLEDFCSLVKLRNHLVEQDHNLSLQKREIETTHKLLRGVGSSIGLNEKSKFEDILKLSEKIEKRRLEMNLFLEEQTPDYEKRLSEALKDHQSKLEDMKQQLITPELLDSNLTKDEAMSRLDILKDKLAKVEKKHAMLKDFCGLIKFSFSETEKMFRKVERGLASILRSWDCLITYQNYYDSWMDNDFKTLKLKSIEDITQKMMGELKKLKGDLEECLLDDNPNHLSVLDILESKVKMVQVLLPVLRLLLREQFKEKHWTRILEKLKNGSNLITQNYFTLKNLKHGGINDQLNEVERVYLEAVSETQMEKEIESIQSEWERTEVRFQAYGEDKSRQVLTGIEFLLLLVDRHLEKIQKMRKFEQIEEIKVTIRNWESKLDLKQKIMRSCEEFQTKWKGLFKIFNSAIGQKQLRSENDLFEKLDKEFLDFTTKAGKKTNILDVFSDPGLEEKFTRLNFEADALIQNLNPFIRGLKDDAKRLNFLSDEDFMTLFGESVDQNLIEHFITRLFPGIASLSFRRTKGKALYVHSVILRETENYMECVQLLNPVEVSKDTIRLFNEFEQELRASLVTLTINNSTKLSIELYKETLPSEYLKMFTYSDPHRSNLIGGDSEQEPKDDVHLDVKKNSKFEKSFDASASQNREVSFFSKEQNDSNKSLLAYKKKPEDAKFPVDLDSRSINSINIMSDLRQTKLRVMPEQVIFLNDWENFTADVKNHIQEKKLNKLRGEMGKRKADLLSELKNEDSSLPRKVLENSIERCIWKEEILRELVLRKVGSVEDFEWKKQPRYHTVEIFNNAENEDKKFVYNLDSEEARVFKLYFSLGELTMEYGFELLPARMMSSLSALGFVNLFKDKCFVTLSNCLKAHQQCLLLNDRFVHQTVLSFSHFSGLPLTISQPQHQGRSLNGYSDFLLKCIEFGGLHLFEGLERRANLEFLNGVIKMLSLVEDSLRQNQKSIEMFDQSINISKKFLFVGAFNGIEKIDPTPSLEYVSHLRNKFRKISVCKLDLNFLLRLILLKKGFSTSESLAKKLYIIFEEIKECVKVNEEAWGLHLRRVLGSLGELPMSNGDHSNEQELVFQVIRIKWLKSLGLKHKEFNSKLKEVDQILSRQLGSNTEIKERIQINVEEQLALELESKAKYQNILGKLKTAYGLGEQGKAKAARKKTMEIGRKQNGKIFKTIDANLSKEDSRVVRRIQSNEKKTAKRHSIDDSPFTTEETNMRNKERFVDNFQTTDNLLKVFDKQEDRRPILLCGQVGSGKSTLLGDFRKLVDQQKGGKTRVVRLFPEVHETQDLFGKSNLNFENRERSFEDNKSVQDMLTRKGMRLGPNREYEDPSSDEEDTQLKNFNHKAEFGEKENETIRQNTKLLVRKTTNKGILEKLLLSRRRNLSQLVLEEVENEYPGESFWERQWVIFDGNFSSQFLSESLHAFAEANFPFIQNEQNNWSRFQFLIWKEKEMLKKELLSVFSEKAELESLWENNRGALEEGAPELSASEKRSLIMMQVLKKLETTRFFFETRSLAQICPQSLTKIKIVHLDQTIFTYDDLIKKAFKRFSLFADKQNAPAMSLNFNDKEYQKKVSLLVKDMKEQVVKKAFLPDKSLFNIKFQDSLVIFEHLLQQLFQKSDGTKTWKDNLKIPNLFLVFALCWGFGAHLRSEARETMFNSIRIKMQQFCTNAFSDYNSPFEFFFDFEKEELVKWSFFITNPKYDLNLTRPFINTHHNISTKKISEIFLSSNKSIFLRGPKSSGKKSLAHHLRGFTERQGVLTVLGPNPNKGLPDIIFSCLMNLRRKKKFLNAKGNKGILLMVEDMCLAQADTRAGSRQVLEFIRQMEISGQFYDPGAQEMLRVKDVCHVLTSHDADHELSGLAPYLGTLAVEPKSNSHLISVFETCLYNFFVHLPNSENFQETKFISSLSKVVRNSFQFLETRVFESKKYFLENRLAKLFELEKSFWQVDQKHFITRIGIVGVFYCEFQRLFGLSLPLKAKQEEFKRELYKKLQLNLNSIMQVSELTYGVVSRFHILGNPSASPGFVSSREEQMSKIIEYIDSSSQFLKISLNNYMMDKVLELNRFLDSPRPVWLKGNSFIGKRTILKIACYLSSIECVHFGAKYINQTYPDLNLMDLVSEKMMDKGAKAEAKEKQLKDGHQWMGFSGKQGKSLLSFEHTLASVSRAENNFRDRSKRIVINPLLEMLKEILIKSFAQVLFQKKYFVLMIGDDLLHFRDRAMVDEVFSVLECLATPFEVVSCFQKKEMTRMYFEACKRDKRSPQNVSFRDWFRAIRHYIKIVLVTSSETSNEQLIKTRYSKLANMANVFCLFDKPDQTKLSLMERLLNEMNTMNFKTLESSDGDTQYSSLKTKTSMAQIIEDPEQNGGNNFVSITQALMKIYRTVKTKEKVLDGDERVGWKNLQRILQGYSTLFPGKVMHLDSKIKKLRSCLDFLGEIDKESFERERRIGELEKKLKSTKEILEKKMKKNERLEKSIERMSKKMREYLGFSKVIKMFDDLGKSVQVTLKHFCKVNQSNYEMGLEDALDQKMIDVTIKGNRVKIGNRLLKNATFQSKIKNFWELKITWRRLMNINFQEIHKVFKTCSENPEDPNQFMLAVIAKFCMILEGKDIEVNQEVVQKGSEQEKVNIDYEFILGFFSKFDANTFVKKIEKFRFIDLKNQAIVKLTREIILFNHQASLEKVYGKDISLLNTFVKRFLLYVDKEMKFVYKVLYKGESAKAKKLMSEKFVGINNSPISNYLEELLKEFFFKEDAAIYLEQFQHSFMLKKQNNMLEEDIIELDQELRDLLDKRRKSQSIGAKLSFEVQEWKLELDQSLLIRNNLEGNCVMALSILEFCPRFPRKVRRALIQSWENELKHQRLSISDNFNLADFMLTPMGKEKIKFKELQSLNNHFEDIFSLEESDLFCALVEPHGMIQDFLPRYFNDLESVVLRVSDPMANLTIKKAVLTGQLLILLKDGSESVNPSVLKLLEKEIKEEKTQEMIDLGDKMCKLHENFRCYLVVTDEDCLKGDLMNLVKIVNLKEFVEIEMEEHLVGVLRSRETVSNEELRKGLLYEKLEEKFQVDSLKNDLLGKILDHLRESQTEEDHDSEIKILELQEDLVNVAEALNITKLTIRERKKETDGILKEIDHRRDEMMMLVREFKQIYLLHKSLQREGKAQGIGVMEMFEVFFPSDNLQSNVETWQKESEKIPAATDRKAGADEDTQEGGWENSEGLEDTPRDNEKLKENLQKILYSVEPQSRKSFLLNSCMRLAVLDERATPEMVGVFMIIVKQIYLKNLEAIQCIRKNREFKKRSFWRVEAETQIKKKNEHLTIPGWKIVQMCTEMGFNSKLVYNLNDCDFTMSGKEGITRFFEAEWMVKNQFGKNQKALGQVEADKLTLVYILENLGYGKWEGLFDKVKQNLIKEKNKGGILSRETWLKDLNLSVRCAYVPTFMKLVIMLIFNPDRFDELTDEFIARKFGNLHPHVEGDWDIIKEKLFEEKSLGMLIRIDSAEKVDFLNRIAEVSNEKEVILLKQGGLFPVNREFLIEYSKKSSFSKRVHSTEEKNFWKVEEHFSGRREFQRKDLLDFLKKTQFQGKTVLIDAADDLRFLGMICDLIVELKKEGDENEEGAVLVMYHTSQDLVDNKSVKKSLQEELYEQNLIDGDFFTLKSNIYDRSVPVYGFSSWSHFKGRKSLRYLFERNFKELIQEILELEEEFNINEHETNRIQSKGSESHFDGNEDSQSARSQSVHKLISEQKKEGHDIYGTDSVSFSAQDKTLIKAYSRLSLFFAILEYKWTCMEIPVFEFGSLQEKVYQNFFKARPTLIKKLKDSALYLKHLIEQNFDESENQKFSVHYGNEEDSNLELIEEKKEHSKSNLDKKNTQKTISSKADSQMEGVSLKLFKYVEELLKAEGYRSLQLAAEFKGVFLNPFGSKYKNAKNISAFKRLEKPVMIRVELEQMIDKFQGRLELYLLKLGNFVNSNCNELLNQREDISSRITEFHKLCKDTLICNKDYTENLFKSQKRKIEQEQLTLDSITDYPDLFISSTAQSNVSMSALINVFHINNIFGLSADYLNEEIAYKNPSRFLENLLTIIPKKIEKPPISYNQGGFSILSLKNQQRKYLNKVFECIRGDILATLKYLKKETDSRPRVDINHLLLNRTPGHWGQMLQMHKMPTALSKSQGRALNLQGFFFKLFSQNQSIFNYQKEDHKQILNLKHSLDPYSLLPALQYKFNKHHCRYLFPLNFNITCFSQSQTKMYIENSKESEEVGLLGFSVFESGFHKNSQELVNYPRVFKNDWMNLLFPSNVDNSKHSKVLHEKSLNVISHQVNIIRMKMTQNIYSPSVEEKFLKENPVEGFLNSQEMKKGEELCVPIYVYLSRDVRFRVGFINLENGNDALDKWLASDVKIKSSN